MKRYSPKDIEPRWQKTWDAEKTYQADLASTKKKYFGMSMFNYPSGLGIHIGHAMNYTISDVMARFKRQQGYESYHPIGWDAFGLPAENYAIKAGVSPQASMAEIIPNYHKQYKAMGWSNDWSKEIATHDPTYYKWTQWIFSQMHKHDLAYQAARMQWWCTKCQTVLANEQVIDGKCWRHDGPDDPLVEKREVKQWFFKITDYAEEILEATDDLDWTESVKLAQKNWIGKSKGAEITFVVDGSNEKITVFTTRPDTLYGATFLVLAPEHELVEKLAVRDDKSKVESYIKEATKRTELERQASKEKTGVFTGSYATNPATNEKIPVWTADYVLVGYGTGAIMAVPAHDERDNEFAEKFDLPIRTVLIPDLTDTTTPPREGLEMQNREAVQVIVKHPSEEKYLLLEQVDWETETYAFVSGGIEEGESIEEAASRELLEESGYKNVKSLTRLDAQYKVRFFHEGKQANTYVHINPVAIELADLEQDEVTEEELSHNKAMWLSAEEVRQKVHGEGSRMAFKTYTEPSPDNIFTSDGAIINSAEYTDMQSAEVREKIVMDLAAKGVAEEKTIYKIRDWSVSRQRYWGAPIPIIHCKDCGPVLVPDEELPVLLPELTDFKPSGDGRSALARATEWLKVDCPKCDGPAERETDTLDTYICSSWYMLRYLDPHNAEKIFDSVILNNWMPVDFYNGADHATAHMIYARFVTRFFHKLGLLDNPEPFKKFLFNGKVTAKDGQMFSKSKGNGVDPLEIIDSGYGADALRTYLMFAAPLDLWVRWDPQGVPGTFRFINRVWNITQEFVEAKPEENGASDKALKIIHPAIQKVTADIEDQKYNTAIAALMKCTNDLYELKAKEGFKDKKSWQFALESLSQLIGPFAPHVADELWHDLGHKDSVHKDHWPLWDDKYLISDTITIAIQVNGKLRSTVEVASDADEETIVQAARSDEKVKAHLTSQPKKTIYVPKKLVNFVV